MTECAKCGDCCEDISIHKSPDYFQQQLEIWGHTDDKDDPQYDVAFILDNWIYNGPDKRNGHQYQCAQFNAETRECMAHDTRPNVCRGYPWYRSSEKFGIDFPRKYKDGKGFSPRCSFNADVRTMLPIVEVR